MRGDWWRDVRETQDLVLDRAWGYDGAAERAEVFSGNGVSFAPPRRLSSCPVADAPIVLEHDGELYEA